jgi:hypothetical protein
LFNRSWSNQWAAAQLQWQAKPWIAWGGTVYSIQTSLKLLFTLQQKCGVVSAFQLRNNVVFRKIQVGWETRKKTKKTEKEDRKRKKNTTDIWKEIDTNKGEGKAYKEKKNTEIKCSRQDRQIVDGK